MTDIFRALHPDDLVDLVRQQPLAWIVSGAAGALNATPLPVQLTVDDDGHPAMILGHFARRNAQLEALAADPRATILLIGPSGYISPSWFADRTQAPTWNYASAVFDVEVRVLDTPADARRLLEGLVGQVEDQRPGRWRSTEMGERYDRLADNVVGFEAQVMRVRSKFKLGQDERDDVFADILRGLDILDQPVLAGWMRRFAAARPAGAVPATQPPASPLDPEIKRFIDEVVQAGRALTAERERTLGRTLGWTERREVAELSRKPWTAGGPVIAETREAVVESDAGPLRLRIYDPAPGQAKPTLIYLHGGGWALFSLDTHDRVMREYAARSGMAVVGLDYALAPEAPYPAALNQVVALVRWLGLHAASLGLSADALALGGDSAGGVLSMGAALRLRDGGHGGAVKAILSNYAGFSSDMSPTARQRYGTSADMLSAAEVSWFWDNYIGALADRRDPYAAPSLAALHELPPTFLAVGECDVFTEQNYLMAGRLLEAGNAVKIKVYPGAPHSFLEAVSISRVASEAIDDGAAWLRTVLGATA
ncbi:alpha/beta hydrolase fold domain-containing protein [Pelomonas sp. KK5]|uniref:alpha/beta hydrolase fold domain-containing protein n=1 Tax=Pelomonas sp. KK5 TaxID=1855730 RepID=UPI0009FA78FD|nr:alpha/beta hydrolase fold domain-containing protein [Pelomonas sp. KK5]